MKKHALKPIGPYSLVTKVLAQSELYFISGQIPMEPQTGKLLKGDIKQATHLVLDHIEAILEEEGLTLAHVVKVEMFLSDMDEFQEVNKVYAQRFVKEPFPARQAVEVARLPMNAPIEISCIAINPNSKTDS